MSEWNPRVVRIGKLGKHPNADTLNITDIEGTPVIAKMGLWQPGDLAVYVPIDSIVPETPDNLQMFGPKLRVKAKKLRGIFSRGVLYPLPEGLCTAENARHAFNEGPWDHLVGRSVALEMGITKWEPPAEVLMSKGRQEPGPQHFMFPAYTDIEGLRKWKSVFESHPSAAREVVITEKVHGANARFCHDGTRLWVGSRTQIKAEDPKTWWWRVAQKMQLAELFSRFPMTVFYGEVFGKGVQDMHYGTEINFRIFDTMDARTGLYNDWDVTVDIVAQLDLWVCPVLYRGPWAGFEAHKDLAEGQTTIGVGATPGGTHVREGFVVKPTTEAYDPMLGRVILKLVGEGYDLR